METFLLVVLAMAVLALVSMIPFLPGILYFRRYDDWVYGRGPWVTAAFTAVGVLLFLLPWLGVAARAYVTHR